MSNELQEHWRGLLKPLFPASAYLRVRQTTGLIIAVDWRLKSGENQPDKFSRLIKIHIPEDVLKSYDKMGATQRKQLDMQLYQHIQQRLQHFNPENDTPRGGIPPQEEWEIDATFFT